MTENGWTDWKDYTDNFNYFNSFQFYIYITKSKQQSPEGPFYCKVKTLQQNREKPNYQTTPCI